MDPIEALKLQTAMKNHKLRNHPYLLYNIVPYLLTAVTCSLLCSYPFWLPSMEHFLFITLPHVRTSLLSPKCLFLVVNAIIAFLLGESKLGGPHSSATSSNEIYEEYVERSRTMKRLSTCPGSESSKAAEDERSTGDEVSEEEEGEEEPGDDNDDKQEAEPEQQEDDDDGEKDERTVEEEDGIPAEELKKRVEEFIARVNKQRWLEARSLMCAR